MNTMNIHTSNIINWKSLRKNPNITSTEEMLYCSLQVVKCGLKNDLIECRNNGREEDVECCLHKDNIDLEEKNDLRINVKLFLMTLEPRKLEEALIKVFKFGQIEQIHTLIISIVPPHHCPHSVSPVFLKDIYALWDVLESYVRRNRILQLGVCDFSYEQLEEFYHNVEIKPIINQIYSRRMRNITEKMIYFCDEHHIQLLTHNDQADFVPTNELKSKFQQVLDNSRIETVKPVWVCRYFIVYRNRGVIRSKGYISQIKWQ